MTVQEHTQAIEDLETEIELLRAEIAGHAKAISLINPHGDCVPVQKYASTAHTHEGYSGYYACRFSEGR
jgi:hypothetical protein